MAETMGDCRVVLTTIDGEQAADRLARELVGRRLAACVNIAGPVRSVYRWKGEIVGDDERLLLIKTRVGELEALERAIRELHPYDVPEILHLPVSGGDSRYLSWIAACLAGGD